MQRRIRHWGEANRGGDGGARMRMKLKEVCGMGEGVRGGNGDETMD